jgi:hypothetical protein
VSASGADGESRERTRTDGTHGDEFDRDPDADPHPGSGSPVDGGRSASRSLDPWPLVVGAFVACGGLLLLAQPVVGRVSLLGARVPAFVLSTLPLAVGFGLGGVVFLRRGKRLVGVAHAVGAVGFGLLFAALWAGVAALWLGIAVLVGGALFLASESRHLR